MKPIVDISYYQKPFEIDYSLVSQNISGVILRAAYGTGASAWGQGPDPAFDRHYQEFHDRGIPIGAYHYIVQYRSAEDQVALMYQAIEGKELKLGLWCDVELEGGAEPLTKQMVHTYMQLAETQIGEFGIYTSANMWRQIMNGAYYTNRKLWVAHYGAVKPTLPQGWTSYWLWQTDGTGTGRIAGYDKGIDLNKFFGTQAQFNEWIGQESPPETEPLTALYYPCDQSLSYITQYFGENPVYYPTSRGHNGIDFGFNYQIGKPIYAAEAGIVETSGEFVGGYGRHIRIRHSHGITIYGHLSQRMVEVGSHVTAKQLIGLSGGNTDDPYCGYSTGPHLHFEYRWDKPAPQVPGGYVYNAVDPLPLLVEWENPNMLFQIKIIINGLNIRRGIGTNYPVAYIATKDTILNVYEVKLGWYRVGVGLWCSGSSQYSVVIEDENPSLEERVTELERRVALLEGE